MAISTKGITRKNVKVEDIVNYLSTKYKDVKLHTSTIDNQFYQVTFAKGEENRMLSIHTDIDSVLRDCGIRGVWLDLSLWGSSVEIMTDILQYFGGYIDFNDCDDIGFESVNLKIFEGEDTDQTDMDKLRNEIAGIYGVDKINEIINLFDKYQNIKVK